MRKIILLTLLISFSSIAITAEKVELLEAPVNLEDKSSLQRGARNFINYCLNCHSASYMRYNQLQLIGLSSETIKQNLLFTADKIGDPMDISMPYEEAKEWFGAAPPNLSVTARSRGADWIYSYLRGFYRDPTREMGWNNTIYKNSAMPHILWELQGEQIYNDESLKLVLNKPGSLSVKEYDQFIGDITNFMVFMSEPNQQKRKQIGYYVLGFLFLLLVLAVNLKREFWKDIK